jgi:hypothetical protein
MPPGSIVLTGRRVGNYEIGAHPADPYEPIRFSSDGRTIYLQGTSPAAELSDLSIRLYRYDIASDRISSWRTLPGPVDPIGMNNVPGMQLLLTPDGRSYVHSRWRRYDELYLLSAGR